MADAPEAFPANQLVELMSFVRGILPDMLREGAFDQAAQARLLYVLGLVNLSLEEYERTGSKSSAEWIRLHCAALTQEIAPGLARLSQEVQLEYRAIVSAFVGAPREPGDRR